MQIIVHDNKLNKVAFLNNDIPGLPSYFNDNWHRYLAEGAATYDISVAKYKNGQLQDYCQFLNEQAYLSFVYEGESQLFSVMTVTEDDMIITLSCMTLNTELINEQVNALANTTSHNLQWYLTTMGLLNYTDVVIGHNELTALSKVLSFDQQESKLSRLISLINGFGGEFEFVTNLNNDGTLKAITLNLYLANDGANVQGVGKKRTDITLYYGKNIQGIQRTVDKTQLFNATTVTGANNMNWNNSAWSVKNSAGVEEFYKRAGATTAYAPLSVELYPSQVESAVNDNWIRKDFTTDLTTANDLWNYALSQFKQFAYPQITYQVTANSGLLTDLSASQPLSIGDTVLLQDENFDAVSGGLILQARVSEIQISFSNPLNNVLTFSNFVKLKSQISDSLTARMAQLVADSTPYRSDLITSNGTQFKNGSGSTTLSARIYFGSNSDETIADSYIWFKDGTEIGTTQEIVVNATDITDKSVYSYQAIFGGKIVGRSEVTVTNVSDGEAGATGPIGPTGPSGPTGINGTPAPSANILNTSQGISCGYDGNTNAAQTITIPFNMYQGITQVACTASYSALPAGMTLTSNTAATASANGSLVFSIADATMLADSTTFTGNITITLTGTVNGTSLSVPLIFSWSKVLSNLVVNSLSALTANLGDVMAGSITNTFTYNYSGTDYPGNLIIDNSSISISYGDGVQLAMGAKISPDGFYFGGTTGSMGGAYNVSLTKNGLSIDGGPIGLLTLDPQNGLVLNGDIPWTASDNVPTGWSNGFKYCLKQDFLSIKMQGASHPALTANSTVILGYVPSAIYSKLDSALFTTFIVSGISTAVSGFIKINNSDGAVSIMSNINLPTGNFIGFTFCQYIGS